MADSESHPAPPGAGGEASADGPGAEDLPTSKPPYETETIRFVQDNEVLVTRLTGEGISESGGPARSIGQFLAATGELAKGLAVQMVSSLGERGAIKAANVGELAVARLVPGNSVDIHFHVEGANPQLSVFHGEAQPMEKAAEEIAKLLPMTGDALLSRSRDLGDRISTDYMDLLKVITSEGLSVFFRSSSHSAYLDPDGASHAISVLETRGTPTIEQRVVVGELYEAEATKRGFRLKPPGKGANVIHGTFPEELRETVRKAWGHQVRANLTVTQETLKRSSATKESVTLDRLTVLDPSASPRSGDDSEASD